MSSALDENRSPNWAFGNTVMVNLVTDRNIIRSHGNTSAHFVSTQDIIEAIATIGFSMERSKLSELYEFLYSEPGGSMSAAVSP